MFMRCDILEENKPATMQEWDPAEKDITWAEEKVAFGVLIRRTIK